MLVIDNYEDLSLYREKLGDKRIGFVPTMGALHRGHLHLAETSIKHCDATVVSIWVNPRQFNDKEDFEKYPRNFDEDIKKLRKVGVDVVFIPKSEEELYKANRLKQEARDLKGLDKPLEGMFRTGHFEAVVEVVYRLFCTVKPSVAYFGKKDFQQFRIIEHFTNSNDLGIEIIGLETIREESGLAMSSRNERLNQQERAAAAGIYKTLSWIKNSWNDKHKSPEEIKEEAANQLLAIPGLKSIDYLEIVNEEDLNPVKNGSSNTARAFIAVYLGPVRLIDNLSLNN
ncbi:pantoate--beta-alanine ligase [Luteibaculum oceani]|uniref:pantoate--beta-alanine ligase n=1 Tax=Luteibaculum oceani TaxID=1294296 RepID=UPI0014770FE8|nr:pantoate--beta-alanine ligase [Luteibaculum oceani]